MMEGLLGFDPEQLKQLMAQFGATEQDRTDANKQAAFAMGFGLLANPYKGQEFQSIGRAGMGAMAARQNSLNNSQQEKHQQMQNAMAMAKMQQAMQGQQAQAAQAQEMAGAFSAGPQLQNMGPGGPTPQNAAATASPSLIEQYRKASVIAAKNGNSESAKRYADIANSLEEQYSTTPQSVKGPNGEIQLAQFGQRGGVKVAQGLSPAEKLHFANTGGMAGVGLDPFTGKPMSAGLPVTMDPAQKDASARGWAGLKQAESHFKAGQASGEIKETDGGLVRIGKDNSVTPIMSGGAQLQKPSESRKKELDSIDAQLATVSGAKSAVKETPSAFGMRRGMATLAGGIPESVAGRLDSKEERTTRSYVYNVVSAAINERAGTAQSAQELARLRTFLPGETDNAKQVEDKLSAYEDYLHEKRKTYSGASHNTPTAQPTQAEIAAEMKRRGLKP